MPEVTISPDEECNESEDSSRSPSPTSRVGFRLSFYRLLFAVYFKGSLSTGMLCDRLFFVLKSSHCSALQSDWLILGNGGVVTYENCSSARNASRLKVGL